MLSDICRFTKTITGLICPDFKPHHPQRSTDNVFKKSTERNIKNGNFTVITDKLVDEKQNEPRTEMTFHKGRYVSYLEFGCNDRWELEGSYYTWSKLYRMSDSGICNTSLVGDEFYLVLYNKNNKILMAYNSRFFDYQKQ